jgi:hypothetical protein
MGLWMLVAGALVGLVITWGEAWLGVEPRLVAHFVVSQACHGTSSGKIVYALAFVAAVAALAAMRSGGERAGPNSKAAGASGWIVAGAAAIGLSGALVSHIAYLWALQLDSGGFSIHWRYGLNSSHALTHIHTSKAAIAWAINQLGLGWMHERFDTGAAYLDRVPGWCAAWIGIAFVVTLGSLLRWLPGVIAGYPARERWRAGLVGSIAGAVLSKAILDGGPLAYDVVAAAMALVAIGRARGLAEVWAWVRSRWAWLVMMHGGGVGLLVLVAPASVELQVERWVWRVALYAAMLWGIGAGAGTMGMIVRAGISVLAAAGVAIHAAGSLVPFWKVRIGHAVVYRVEPEGTQARRIDFERAIPAKDAYVRLGDRPGRARWVSLGTRGTEAGEAPRALVSGLIVEIVILHTRGRSIEFRPDPIVFISAEARDDDAQRAQHDDPFARLMLRVEFDPVLGPVLDGHGWPSDVLADSERFVAWHLLDGCLRRAGIEEYVARPIAEYTRDASK